MSIRRTTPPKISPEHEEYMAGSLLIYADDVAKEGVSALLNEVANVIKACTTFIS